MREIHRKEDSLKLMEKGEVICKDMREGYQRGNIEVSLSVIWKIKKRKEGS